MSNTKRTFECLAISLRPLWSFGWRMLITLTVCRAVFVAWQWQRLVDAELLGSVLVQGLRFDFVLLGLMLVIPVICFPIFASNRFLVPAWRSLLSVCLPIALLLLLIMECATPSFVDQFDSRPNMLFFEYLNHPREVGATVWAGYKLPIILTVLMVTAITWLNSKKIGELVRPIQPIGVMPALLATPWLLLFCFGLIRSTTDHLPVNAGTVAISSDPLVNDLALDSATPRFTSAANRSMGQKVGFAIERSKTSR